jgi:hypothetical protein
VAAGKKTGGRTKGTPNKRTEQVRTFLDRVFEQAFRSKALEKKLVKKIIALELDPRLLTLLLHYYAGRPAVAVDHTVEGTLTLAQIIAGEVPATEPEE